MPEPFLPLSDFYMFPYYSTREQYEQITGKTCPPFDPNKQVKYWEDTAATSAGRRVLVYERVATDLKGAVRMVNGKPAFQELVLLSTEAALVNIPDKRPGMTPNVGDGIEVPPPMRALPGGYELAFRFGGTLAIRNTGVPLPSTDAPQSGGFTAADRDLLLAIAVKLGV